jgi:hypothetical protein
MPWVISALVALWAFATLIYVVVALGRRRVAWGYLCKRRFEARRDERPVLYWFVVILNLLIVAGAIYVFRTIQISNPITAICRTTPPESADGYDEWRRQYKAAHCMERLQSPDNSVVG